MIEWLLTLMVLTRSRDAFSTTTRFPVEPASGADVPVTSHLSSAVNTQSFWAEYEGREPNTFRGPRSVLRTSNTLSDPSHDREASVCPSAASVTQEMTFSASWAAGIDWQGGLGVRGSNDCNDPSRPPTQRLDEAPPPATVKQVRGQRWPSCFLALMTAHCISSLPVSRHVRMVESIEAEATWSRPSQPAPETSATWPLVWDRSVMNGYPLAACASCRPSRSHTRMNWLNAVKKLRLLPLQATCLIRCASATGSRLRKGFSDSGDASPATPDPADACKREGSHSSTVPPPSPVTSRDPEASQPRAVNAFHSASRAARHLKSNVD